ncbi:MAG: lysine N(6)-hydroxylase/L-ornithine N(5)-oxygenase family protein [Endozoicomonas sp.]
MNLTQNSDQQTVLDLVGLGVGPFNLSLAALLDRLPGYSARFYDRKPSFSWHPGLMLSGAHMQTSCLKDMVTPVQPTSPWSFISYLVQQERFYQFLATEKTVISRKEFVDYMSWIAGNLPSLQFNSEIREIDFKEDRFILRFDKKEVKTRNICLGTGKMPHVPECTRSYLGEDCFHASELGARQPDFGGRKIAVVGGGQTGAEVFLNALRGNWGAATEVQWISRRPNFEPLDETPFTNEFFTPGYVESFYPVPASRKSTIIKRQKLASDGITPAYLIEIYRELYDRTYLSGSPESSWDLLPDRALAGLSKTGNGRYELMLKNALHDLHEVIQADIVILCTGFEHRLPQYLEPLQPSLKLDEESRFQLSSSFRIRWDGPDNRRIYAVNAGMHSHGIAEPQLSLAAWRSATIINDMAGREVFRVSGPGSLINWQPVSDKKVSAYAA